jgi:hypothetical protein
MQSPVNPARQTVTPDGAGSRGEKVGKSWGAVEGDLGEKVGKGGEAWKRGITGRDTARR